MCASVSFRKGYLRHFTIICHFRCCFCWLRNLCLAIQNEPELVSVTPMITSCIQFCEHGLPYMIHRKENLLYAAAKCTVQQIHCESNSKCEIVVEQETVHNKTFKTCNLRKRDDSVMLYAYLTVVFNSLRGTGLSR